MTVASRRRFLTLSAALAVASGPAAALPVSRFRGTAMDSSATPKLAHPDAGRIAEGVWTEIDRLEDILSLRRTAPPCPG